VGVGWQESEYEALGADFRTRGARMDEAIAVLRSYWSEPQVTLSGPHYRATAMGMEPKPPQGRRLPIWIGGASEAALRRVGRLGDGWLASRVTDAEDGRRAIAAIRRHAEEAGRDPGAIGLQSMVAPPPRDAEGKRFYADPARVVARVGELKAMGFDGVALNATAVFQAGARSVDAMVDALGGLHDRLRAEVG
jgi:alkanesulfonate monooxygenase SsuD/methylene tetrahydromethanopterin reductase-like flavin-dependent oxidoreductase (luciferase family)